MIDAGLSSAERLKFDLLADGLAVSPEARRQLEHAARHRALTSADYASTSGLVLVLDEDVWVNAPIVDHNPNFVQAPPHHLVIGPDGQFVVRSGDVEVRARYWIPPAFHDDRNRWNEPYTSYAFTHGDRVRVSPVEGCAMTCTFCDLPYEFRYRTKRVAGIVDAVQAALADPVQPAAHVLISGGTPRPNDYGYVLESYEAVLDAVPPGSVDIMMVPIAELFPLERLDHEGLGEISVNLELFGRDAAKRYMRRKFDQGRDHYLAFLEQAAMVLGGSRVRSMLMVGLEPLEDTLEGVDAIARRGCVPVLSPFRPDGSTPLRAHPAPTAAFLVEAFVRSSEIAHRHGVPLGAGCIPCTHNTLTLASSGAGDAFMSHGQPVLV